MNILILGGDGYLGWPTAMHLSAQGASVTVVDNYLRRTNCKKLDVEMLYPVPTLQERARLWYEKSGREIKVVIGDLTDAEVMRGLFEGRAVYDWAIRQQYEGPPDTVVHYAEQPSAPFSQMSCESANLTLVNNLLVTNNLMFALKDFSPATHVVHIGTMGEYGTPNIDIEEGWIDIDHKGRRDRFLFPRQASSLYHTSKIMDTDLMWFAVRTWGLRVTDLMQGPVYGMETDENAGDDRLYPLFSYDEIFGTIVNRFVTQAVTGFPITVYGSGGQTRGYLNLRDTLQCVRKSVENPAKPGELRIFNQIMETFSVNELAEKIQGVGRELDYDVRIENVSNPRKEAEDHYYNPCYRGLQEMGVVPHYLTGEVLAELFRLVERYKHNVKTSAFFRGVSW